ncbi:MAG: SDR family oxidoreductase [Candidatus Accumulibacter sp.]|nr:SDR family oxidoreductase [Accumulibacter sp.]
MNGEYSGKNYLVVGASSGIGRSVCLELGAQGANVILVARHKQALEETLQLMPRGKHTILPFDIADISDIEMVVTTMQTEYNHIDGLIFSAGKMGKIRLRDNTYATTHEFMQINFYPFIEFIRCLVRKKTKAQSMRVVCISSLASVTHEKYLTAYAASKAAMEAAVRCLGTELAAKNMTINAVRPAFVKTEMLAEIDEITGDFNEHIKSTGYQPLGLIDPNDVAKLAIYLLSNAAKSITGATLSINAGAVC